MLLCFYHLERRFQMMFNQIDNNKKEDQAADRVHSGKLLSMWDGAKLARVIVTPCGCAWTIDGWALVTATKTCIDNGAHD